MKIELKINKLTIRAFHGLFPEERVTGNTFVINVIIEAKVEKSLISDTISDTIDYGGLVKTIEEVMTVPCNLIEHLAANIVNRLFNDFSSIVNIDLSIEKLSPPKCNNVYSTSVRLITDVPIS